jgi:chemotaxis protein MotB
MNRQILIIASALTTAVALAVLGLSSCVKSRELERVQAELERSAADLEQARAAQTKDAAEAAELKAKLAESLAQTQELEQEKEAASQSHKSLEEEMRAALESKDVAISQLQGKLTVSILDRILFDSGEADLRPDGAAVLRKVAGVLAQHPNLKAHVIGHTDNVPIRAGARSRFASNWELSTARALAAVRFLTEQAGVDPRRIGAVGYGEFRPVADNATAEGRSRNRRIAITILPDELAGADTVPTATTNAPGVAQPPAPPPEDAVIPLVR